MNFHFKHEFLGRVVYSIQTENNENGLIFGNSTFFVTIYQGDQFIIGWEVEENDFLYWFLFFLVGLLLLQSCINNKTFAFFCKN